MTEIFISHTTKDNRDHALAHYIANGLIERGIQVWIAPDSIPAGSDWEEEIVAGIMEESSHFLVILSAASVRSEWVLNEIGLAQKRKEKDDSYTILPLFVGDVDDFPGEGFISKSQNLEYQVDHEEQLREIANVLGLPAFISGDEVLELAQEFRDYRLTKIKSKELLVELPYDPKVVLHIVSLSTLDGSMQYDLALLDDNPEIVYKWLSPIYGYPSRNRFNADGYLTISTGGEERIVDSYLQVFNNGCIETVDTSILYDYIKKGRATIPSTLFERYLIIAVNNYLRLLDFLGVVPPIYVMLSLQGVKDYHMAVNQRFSRWPRETYPIDRDSLLIEGKTIDSFNVDIQRFLQSIFDEVWNAAGYPKSLNYDKDGKWNPPN